MCVDQYASWDAARRSFLSASDLFKAGYLVEDIEAAMRDMGRWLGVEWTPVQESPLVLETPAGRQETLLRYAYSTRGPVHLELLQSQPDGYYAAPGGSHLHHVGRWVDDLAAESARLAEQGLAVEALGVGPDGTAPAMFAFHHGTHGVRLELVDRANRPAFEAWLAGGTLELG